MDSPQRVANLLDDLYASILDEAMYPLALRALMEFTGSVGIAQVKYDLATGTVLKLESIDVDLDAQREYELEVSPLDIRLPAAAPVPVGEVMTEYTLVDPQLYQRSAVHAFLWRRDIPYLMGTWVEKGADSATVLSLLRSRSQGPFDDADRARYEPLLPQLIRGIRLRDAMQAARATHRAVMDVLDDLPFGVIFLDARQRVLEASAVATRLLREARSIHYVSGAVRALRADADRRLQAAIGRAVDGTASVRDGARGETVLMGRIDSGGVDSLAVLPVRSGHLFGANTPACMLILFDPMRSTAPAIERVRHALQLSAAEARLACTLFKGVSLRHAADELQVSINTCKSQLKSIYAKTGCRNQVDLAKALLLIGIAQRP